MPKRHDSDMGDYTPTQAARIMNCSVDKVREICRQGYLKSYKLGERTLRIPRSELAALRKTDEN